MIVALAIGAAALSADAEIPRRVSLESPQSHAPTWDDEAGVIYEQALLAGVEPALVFGVVAQESGLDPAAVGRHGERGLMQIKPSTARAYDARITPEALYDPEVNVRLGLRHLKREVEFFGDPSLGLMSYYMGRARLEREMADGLPPRDRYVERVLSSCGTDCA